MEVIFGVQGTDRSLRVQLADDEIDELRKKLDQAFAKDATERIVWVTDKDGVDLGIAVDKIAFVEFGAEKSSRQVGFSAAS